MGNKTKSKKKSTKMEPIVKQRTDDVDPNGDIEKLTEFVEEQSKRLCKELPFASISNKQFKKIGLTPDKKPAPRITTIPLRFPSKLVPALKKIFGLNKIKENTEHSTTFDDSDISFITLISFQSFVQNGQKIKPNTDSIPTFQIIQIPISSKGSQKKFSLYFSETSIKESALSTVTKLPIPNIDSEKTPSTKVTKKRSFFNDIWRRRSIPPTDLCSVLTDLKPDGRAQSRSTSPNDINLNDCIVCGKQAFLAEKIQIGPDVFHNACFKCCHCSKGLYRGKWNKHQDQYYCDYCYKRVMWPFIRR